MSISSMLGGPPSSASRELSSSSQHYPSPAAAPVSGPGFAPPVHASPRMHSASSEYPPFRRPQTPDHQRPYDPRGSTAPSPRGHYSTPDLQRYGTPQGGYHSRHPSAPSDTSREPGRMSAGPPPTPTSNPSSKLYGGMPPRQMDMARPDDAYARREDVGRPAQAMEYNHERSGSRPYAYDEHFRSERERPGPPEPRDREGRDRAYSGGDSHRHMMPQHDMSRRESHPSQPPPYGRPLDARDQRDPRDGQWGHPGAEANYRAPMDHQRPPLDAPPPAGPFPPHHVPSFQPPPPDRYAPSSQAPPPPPAQSSSAPPPPPQLEQPDRARMDHVQQQHQHHHLHRPRPVEEAPQPSSIGYAAGHGPPPFDPARGRNIEEPAAASSHQRNLLAVQDMSRKGRISPLPQAVQGAQPQHPGPVAEPGIKSEFGRMFSGIGSGVGAIASSPVAGAAAAYGNAGATGAGAVPIKREDAEHAAPDSGPEAATKSKSRRRKLKDDESRGEEDGSGRQTPGGRPNKRSKAHPHHHHHHHHHHHRHGPEAAPSPTAAAASCRNLKGGASGASPTEKATPAPHHHHHHHHGSRAAQGNQGTQGKQPAQSPTAAIPPKPKTSISSRAVLEAVSHRPRHHLGDFIYEPGLRPGRRLLNTFAHRGFSSNPTPLPMEMIKDKENCILTVKVPRIHLSDPAREEITARAYLWGTDVYTDDSDVVAACIHSGWIKGGWAEDFDASMLDLEDNSRRKSKNRVNDPLDCESEGLIDSPPSSGPLPIPANRDLHVNVLILPRLLKYAATTRHGISSREFGGQHGTRHSAHDGISYMINSIRWVENGGQPQARLRGKARRERMRKVMKEVTASFGNANGQEQQSLNHQHQQQQQQQQPQQQQRDGQHDRDQRAGALRGEITGNWRAKEAEQGPHEGACREDDERQPSEGDKENRLAGKKIPAEAAKDAKAKHDGSVEMTDADTVKKLTTAATS
ncbi:hypothetical protein CDD83_682 [Cordyceps sp. RAO-2017]|nr:hypothetical protein CDD83_682 [Cordyceps sp. RAO-2017]